MARCNRRGGLTDNRVEFVFCLNSVSFNPDEQDRQFGWEITVVQIKILPEKKSKKLIDLQKDVNHPVWLKILW